MGGSLVETEQMSFSWQMSFFFFPEGLVWKPIMLLGMSVVDMLPAQFATKWGTITDWIGSCYHIKQEDGSNLVYLFRMMFGVFYFIF